MKKEFKLPNLGENISSAEIIRLMVAVGDKLEKEQSVAEISSDKATLEVPSDVSGTITEILVKEGDSVSEGQVVLTVESEGGAAAEAEKGETAATEAQKPEDPAEQPEKTFPTEAKPEPAASAETEVEPAAESTGSNQFILPNLGENITSAEVLRVMVAVGDKVEKNQPVVEISSDKATIEVPSEVSGTITEIHVKEGDSVSEGQVVLTVSGGSGTPQPAAPAKKAESPAPETKAPASEPAPKNLEAPRTTMPAISPKPRKPREVAPASPSVRRFAREIGIDINLVPGSGPGGRISIEDVKTFSRERNTQGGSPAAAAGTAYTETLPDFGKWGEISREAMNNVRYKTAQHLGYAWATIPHVTHFEKADITELEKLRKNFGKKAEAAGAKLTMTAILLKIMAHALKAFPKFNASIDLAKKEIIYKKYYHLGLAVDTDRGLLVPVIRDVDRKNIIQIAAEVGRVAEKARNKKLTGEDMSGATFTISNLGGIGGVNFTPVVNSPEVAILGVSQSSFEPVYRDGTFEPRLIMPVSLSYDHRLIDGADAARFMRWVKEAIENPFLLLLEG